MMTTVADTVENQVVLLQVEGSKNVCILCLSSSINFQTDLDTRTSFEWKKKLFELTKLDAAYLHLHENNYSVCKDCQKQINLLEEISVNFETVREKLKNISTDICTAVLHANLKMGRSVPELISGDFQEWNASRIKEMLSEKNSEFPVVEIPEDVVMLHYGGDLDENVEIPDIFISQLYEDLQLPIEIGSDFILSNTHLSNLCENVVKIETCDLPESENNKIENGNDSAVDTSISTPLISEIADNGSFLDEGSEYSFMQFQGLTVAINTPDEATENSTQSEPIISFQKLDANGDVITNSTVVSSKAFQCPMCDISYTRRYRLSHHINTRHNNNPSDDSPDVPKKQIQCLRCPKTFTRAYSLKQHVKNIHGRDGNPCDKCDRSFSSPKLLELHQTKHESPKFECPICKKVVLSKKSFKIHVNGHYANKLPGPVVTCHKCGVTNDSPALIISHMETHIEDSSSFLFETAEILDSENEKQMFACTLCTDTFEDEKLFRSHAASHSSSDTFLCDECGDAFSSKYLLTAHSRKHKKPTEYKCDICGKVLYKKWNFKNHMMVHSGEKPHKCPKCDRSFAQKSLLINHIRKHTGELPYKCPHCPHPGFSYQVGLRKHLSISHRDEYLNFKKFLCELCWKNFAKESDLSKHAKIHEKHKCKLCHRQFRMLGHLKEHLLRHADMKLFPCPCCDKSFLRESSAVQHLKKVHPDHVPAHEAEQSSFFVVTVST